MDVFDILYRTSFDGCMFVYVGLHLSVQGKTVSRLCV